MIKANLLVDSCDANGTLLNWLWMHRCADWSRLAIIPSDRSRKPMWVLFSYKNMTLSLPGSQRRVVKMLCSNWDLAGITWSSYAYGYKSINSQSATSCNVIRWNSKKKKYSIWNWVCEVECVVIDAARGFHGYYLIWKWLNGVYGFRFPFSCPKLRFIVEQQPSAQPAKQVLAIVGEKILCFNGISMTFQHILDSLWISLESLVSLCGVKVKPQ